MPSFIADHSEIPANRPGGVAVDLRGVSTGWTSGTTFTLSGTAAAGSSILTKIFTDATHYRLVIQTVDPNPPSLVLSLAITDSNGVAITTPIMVKRYRRPRWFAGLAR